MKTADIQGLIASAGPALAPRLMETHISWVLLLGRYAYKIKKAVRFDFLDTASLASRHHLCQEEVRLNRRLAPALYLGVIPVRQVGGRCQLGGQGGRIIDYAVQMQRLDPARQMDRQLALGAVTPAQMQQLGVQHRAFFAAGPPLPYRPGKPNHTPLAWGHLRPFVRAQLGAAQMQHAEAAMTATTARGEALQPLMRQRQAAGWVRDLHGDLHSANIFLYDPPVVFDCLEFSPALRQIDLLDEAAFLGMDLWAQGYPDLEAPFLAGLLGPDYPLPPALAQLYRHYQAYRAWVRAKVQAWQAKLAPTAEAQSAHLRRCTRYLELLGVCSRAEPPLLTPP